MARPAARLIVLMVAAASSAAVGLVSPVLSSQRSIPPYRIEALKAMLFYGQTGTFSPDLFGPSAPTLQNVTSGEGQAIATLVVVEVIGRPDSYAPARKVALTATAGKRLVLSRTVALGRPGDDGKFYAAFWLYDTGCMPVSLKVQIAGQTPSSAVQKTLNFKCGD